MLRDQRLLQLSERKNQLYADFEREVEQAKNKLDTQLRVVDRDIRSLRSEIGDLDVLVRITQGPVVEVYHSADDPCGRVTGRGRHLSSFHKTTESELRTSRPHLSRCAACGWGKAALRPVV